MNTPLHNRNVAETDYIDEPFKTVSRGIENIATPRSENSIVGELTRSWADGLGAVPEGVKKVHGVSVGDNFPADMRRTTSGRVFTSEELPTIKIQMDVVNRLKPTLSAIQEWEGYVIGVSNSHAIVNLVDITAGESKASDQAEIPLEEFAETDIPKLFPGRVLRWVIGYQRSPSGTKMRVSQIVLRDLPRWTAKELGEAKKEAAELFQFFSKDD